MRRWMMHTKPTTAITKTKTKPKRLHTDASHDMYLHIGSNQNLNLNLNIGITLRCNITITNLFMDVLHQMDPRLENTIIYYSEFQNRAL